MKVIFEKETQIGLCDAEPGEDGKYNHALAVPWPIYAYTRAEFNASTVSLNLQHKCYLRLNDYQVDQPWIRLHHLSHTVFGSEADMMEWASDLHSQFIVKSANCIPARFMPPEKPVDQTLRGGFSGFLKRLQQTPVNSVIDSIP